MKAISGLRGLSQAQHGIGGKRLFMAQAQPWVAGIWIARVGQASLPPVADEKQVAEHRYTRALPSFPQQRGYRHAEQLAEQVEQRALDRGDRMHRGAQIEGLQATPGRHRGRQSAAEWSAESRGKKRPRGPQPPSRPLREPAVSCRRRNLARAGVAGIVGKHNDVAGEEWRVGAAQVQQHAVVAGNRDYPHAGYTRR